MISLPARLGALALGLAMVTAGCGGDAGGSAAPAGQTVQTLRYVAVGAPATAIYDPHGGVGNQSDLTRFALMYDVLATLQPDGTLEPRLATSFEADDKLTTWTIRLRQGVTFTDGRPVRAADVLFSLRRIADKAAENFGRMAMFDMDASRVVDEHTLELVTVKPYAEVPRALASFTFVVPEGTTAFDRPVTGSGPYRMTSGNAQRAVLERNDRWWGDPPPTPRIELMAVPDPQARAQAVISGQADVASSVSPCRRPPGFGEPEPEGRAPPGRHHVPVRDAAGSQAVRRPPACGRRSNSRPTARNCWTRSSWGTGSSATTC
ncbi:ABC transporter substrate-binding protein [Nonomuraea salmonea]|uniref:ABC transporter substrate-binding protein n=1 Tax=Nonomuraea salmonea TaxID=46181 RepID=UPI002FEA93C2